tara:strand:+ start:254 stop:472 length:219 start_codon:yes stop_codon:yes gene_type:complete
VCIATILYLEKGPNIKEVFSTTQPFFDGLFIGLRFREETLSMEAPVVDWLYFIIIYHFISCRVNHKIIQKTL